MKLLVLCTLVSIAFASSPAEDDILSDEFINSINEKQTSWTAGRNFPRNTTNEFLRRLSGQVHLHPDPNYKPTVSKRIVGRVAIPSSFDARNQWPKCQSLLRIRDQGACGSCWAFAAVETISDRLCIHSNGAQDILFSPEELLACCSNCGDCSYGYMMPAYDYYIQSGLVSGGDANSNEGCLPYETMAHDAGQKPACVRTCRKGYPLSYSADKHYGTRDYVVSSAIDEIQYDVMTNGPLMVNFEVFEDFYSYQSGVYHHVQGKSVGYHVVKIIGWGQENGSPYWLMANSWGTGYGEKGYFKFLRGRNECGIESNPYAVMPRV